MFVLRQGKNMSKKILISPSSFGKCGDKPLELLRANSFELVVNSFGRKLSQEEIEKLGKECIGIIAGLESFDAQVLQSLPLLRCISRCGVGVDNVDLDKAKELGIRVKNTPDGPTRAVAELTVGVVLDLLRSISYRDRELRRGNWRKGMGSLLQGKNIGVLGLGNIGRSVAELMIALGAKVAASEINPDREWCERNKVPLVSLAELLKRSEILCVHVSYSNQNKYLINKQEIHSMAKGAYLVNLSRGGVVNEDALYKALVNGHLSGAAIDVFEDEPYAGPLVGLDNVVLTPHIGSYAKEARLKMEVQAVKNLLEEVDA